MRIKTLLNRVQPVKGFVYDKVELVPDLSQPDDVRLDVTMRARRGSRGVCSSCGRRGPTYDTLPARRFDFVPISGGGASRCCWFTRCGGSTAGVA